MSIQDLKRGYLALTVLNTLAASYFFNYLFFFLHDRFGFGNRGNLWVSAMHGAVYVVSAWQCGKFAQRRGLLNSLKIGFGSLALLMVVAGLLDSAAGVLCVFAVYSCVLLFTWPALEALTSEGETPAGVQYRVGLYNCTWSAAAALAYFTGGSLYECFGRGAVFWVPAGLFSCQLVLTFWLARKAALGPTPATESVHEPTPCSKEAAAGQGVRPAVFLKMAWLANPFSYVALNTLLAVMPGVGDRLGLSPREVGWFCSIWQFGRLAAFIVLWRWTGWHYRFGWLLAAFLALIASFILILMSVQIWLVVAAQVFLGLASGLIYYSSLFYSMDAGDTKGEHGGLHEAFIGAGIFAGPAAGAAALTLLPHSAHAATWTVSGLLAIGLGGLVWLRLRHAK
jgi:predicted MFS family arabinose efflux permease